MKVIIRREGFKLSKGTDRWLRGLVSAVIDGVSTAFLIEVVDHHGDSTDFKRAGMILLLAGGRSLFSFLKANPLPPEDDETTPVLGK